MLRRITWVLTALALTSGAGLVSATPASAQADYPPPTQHDECGTANDTFTIAYRKEDHSNYTWQANGDEVYAGTYSTKGAGTVVIERYDKDAGVWEPTYTFTYDTSPCTATEAPNRYSVSLGKCIRDSGLTPVIARVDNVADATNRTRSFKADAERSDGFGTFRSFFIEDVADGESGSVTLGTGQYEEGMPPGQYKVRFGPYEDDVTWTHVRSIFVPNCGTATGPDDPGAGGGGNPPPNATWPDRPQGKLFAKRGGLMRVWMSNRYTRTATYRIQVGNRRQQVVVVPSKRVKNRILGKRFGVRPGGPPVRLTVTYYKDGRKIVRSLAQTRY